MKMLRLAVCLSAMLFVCSCSDGGGANNGLTAMGTPVSLTVFNGFFRGYSTAGSQLGFSNMTGSVIFSNITGANSHKRCSGSYTIVAAGPTLFESQQVTESITSLALLTGPTAPSSTVSQRYFLVSNRDLYKITYVPPGTLSYIPPTFFTMPPNPANVGESGTIATLGGNDGSTLTIEWALNPEFSGNSIMTITSTTRNILSVVTTTEVDRYYLDRAGNPYKIQITVTSGVVTTRMTGNKT